MKNILVACEESQAIVNKFREAGFNAFSADLQECSGGHPEWHVCGDCLPLLVDSPTFKTQDGETHHIDGKWDFIMAHPPCTYLTVTGARWFLPEGHKTLYAKDPAAAVAAANQRKVDRLDAAAFFMKFVWSLGEATDRLAIENPVGVMSTWYRKPDQIIQPYQFGDPFEKKTCLWLFNLPKLVDTNNVKDKVPPRKVFKSGKTMATWYAYLRNDPDRAKIRSKTFDGIAQAIVDQWGKIFQ